MPTIFTPNGVSVECIFTSGLSRVENIYHVTKGSPATGADLAALGLIIRNWENTTMAPLRHNSVSLVLIELTALDAAGAPTLLYTTGLPVVGTIAGSSMPNFNSVAIKHTTGVTGRSKRGRTYFIGLCPVHLLSADTITAAYVTSFTNAYNTLRTNLAAAGWTFVINSKYSGVTIVGGRRVATPRANGIMQAVTASSVENAVDTQRHRKLPYQL